MGKSKFDPHVVIRKDAAGNVRTVVTVADAKSAQVIADKMRRADPTGTVEIEPTRK